MLWSLMVGSVGLQAAIASEWLQALDKIHKQRKEEEEILTPYDADELGAVANASPGDSSKQPSSLSTPGTQQAGTPTQTPRSAADKSTADKSTADNGRSRPAQSTPRSGGKPGIPRPEWEFKLVHADRDLFQDPSVFRQLCEEEAQAGWVMLEKLDDRRVRFKRAIVLRDRLRLEHLGFDPYRTFYGRPATLHRNLVWVGLLLGATLLPAYLGYALVQTVLGPEQPVNPAPAPTLQAPPTPAASASPTPPLVLPNATTPPLPGQLAVPGGAAPTGTEP